MVPAPKQGPILKSGPGETGDIPNDYSGTSSDSAEEALPFGRPGGDKAHLDRPRVENETIFPTPWKWGRNSEPAPESRERRSAEQHSRNVYFRKQEPADNLRCREPF